jgi:hypothetical protein
LSQRENILKLKASEYSVPVLRLIFLRRVGGGYVFVHRLSMEHFVAMYQEEFPAG